MFLEVGITREAIVYFERDEQDATWDLEWGQKFYQRILIFTLI